jgi:probable rRNA maturation factor
MRNPDQDRRHEVAVEVQDVSAGGSAPSREHIGNWARLALDGRHGELTVRIVDEPESAALNARYRRRSGPTNVLAFPSGAVSPPAAATGPLPRPRTAAQRTRARTATAEAADPLPLGDLVICAPVVAREAGEQGKPLEAHWAHMVIHGALHVIGYDHETDAAARVMEQRERELLAALGFADPY